jgi:hypothetical protein
MSVFDWIARLLDRQDDHDPHHHHKRRAEVLAIIDMAHRSSLTFDENLSVLVSCIRCGNVVYIGMSKDLPDVINHTCNGLH